jgi:hypothetical protein
MAMVFIKLRNIASITNYPPYLLKIRAIKEYMAMVFIVYET